MAFSKIILNGTTLMDVTDKTVVAASLESGKTALGADGQVVTGTGPENRDDLTVPKDVDFVDYDGRLLYSYTAAEFLELTELPANPTNAGLVAQGWNWTLADAKDFVGKYGALVVGQSYTTNNGRTKYYIEIPNDVNSNYSGLSWTYTVALTSTAAGSPTIYWGDGTSDVWSTNANTQGQKQHTYTTPGKYTIEIEVTSGEISVLGPNNSWRSLVATGQGNSQYLVANTVKRVEIGNNVTGLGYNPFIFMHYLEAVTMPKTLLRMNNTNTDNVFGDNYLSGIVFPINFNTTRKQGFIPSRSYLKYIAIPKSMTSCPIGTYQQHLRKLTMYSYEPVSGNLSTLYLYDSINLTHYVVMGTYTTISTDACRSTHIKKLFIPASVTAINKTAFSSNSLLREVHLLPTSPPTLTTSSFGNNNASLSNATIYVPYSEDHSILALYQSATNWSTYINQMQEEPQS